MGKKLFVGVFFILIALLPLVSALSSNSTSASEWLMFGRTLDNNRYYPSSVNMSHFGLLWSFEIGDTEIASSPSVDEGILYIGSGYQLYALNATNGSILWNYTTAGPVYSSPAIAGNMVYVGSLDNQIYCLNATNGTLLWNYTTGGDIFSPPVIEKGVAYIGSFDDQIYAFNATNGTLIWNYTTSGHITSSASVSEGVAYITSRYDIYAFNATNGTLIWNSSFGGDTPSSPVIYNGTLYIGSDDHNLYAFNATNGSLIWNYSTGLDIASTPVVANGLLYAGSLDQKVYALNLSNGNPVWNHTALWAVYSSPVVANDTLFIGSYDNYTYAFNAFNGTMLWNYSTTSVIISSPAIADQRLYIAGYDYNVYAFSAIPNKPPSITINTPSDNYYAPSFNITFNLTVTDDFDISLFCNLSVDGEVNQSNISFTNGTSQPIYAAANFSEETHTWNVTCWDTENSANTSTTRNLTVDTIPPSTAPNITSVIDSNHDGNIELNWTADPNAASYGIFRSDSNVSTAVSVTRLANTTGDFFEDNTSLHNTEYWYLITSIDLAGNENLSLINTSTGHSINATANDSITPRLPTNITVTNSSNTATISWPAVTSDISGNSDSFNLIYKIWHKAGGIINTSLNITENSFEEIPNTDATTNSTTFSIPSSCGSSCNYMFLVTVIDDAGLTNNTLNLSEYVIANVSLTYTQSSGSSSTSDSDSGGGGGGIPSLFEKKQDEFSRGWASIENSLNITIDRELIPITYVELGLKEKADNVVFTVATLEGHPNSIAVLGKEAYSFMKITARNLFDSNLVDPILKFKVRNSWLSDNGFEKGDIFLYRYNDRQWNKLETDFLSTDSDYHHYSARIPGFSYFAIASVKPPKKSTQSSSAQPSVSQPQQSETSQQSEDTSSASTALPDAEEKKSSKWIWITLIIVLFVAAAAIGGYFTLSLREEQKLLQFEMKEKQLEIPRQLINYIQLELSKKVPKKAIKQALLSKGWPEPVIDEAFEFLGSHL